MQTKVKLTELMNLDVERSSSWIDKFKKCHKTNLLENFGELKEID